MSLRGLQLLVISAAAALFLKTAFILPAQPERAPASHVSVSAWAEPRVTKASWSVPGTTFVASTILGLLMGRLSRRTAMKAATQTGQVKLKLNGGKATPAPPVGPAIGGLGLNIAMFVKEYNALTADKVGSVCPCIVKAFADKTFTIEIKTPPTADLLHKAIGRTGGSGRPGTDIVGSISLEKLEEIAKIKLADLNVEDVPRAMKIVAGTARASGIKIDGYEEWLKTIFPVPLTILDRYGRFKKGIPAPWGDAPPLKEAPVPAGEA